MRASGILMGISSIPSKYGIGCFSKEAYEFVDQLEQAGQQYWQILPLGPTGYGDSPYQSVSTFAGNPYFINLEDLIEKGLLTREECESCDWGGSESYVDYEKMYMSRYKLLRKAYERADLSKEAEKELEEEIDFYRFQQYCFTTQWRKLKAYANEKGISIIGDVPIYVALDSSDAWVNPEMLQFDKDHNPKSVAGCPPDAFSATGQLWGNPLYDWKKLKATGYDWWVQRMQHCLELYDVVRIDHFRGFDEYYAIPYGETTAQKGKWEKGPGMDLFNTLNKKIENLRVIAEDLGFLTKSVLEMLKESGYPGMKVLQFAFDGSENSSYLPYKYEHNCVVYTGTHDNETTKGWLENLQGHDRDFVREYINCYEAPVNDCVWALIRTALASVADLAIIPIQDYLCLGNEARMNEPATLGDNWKWRLTKGQISDMTLYHMREVTRIYGRLYREPAVEVEEETEADEKEELNNSAKDDKIKK